jgi:adenine-specific DNA glycosylase
LPRRVLAEDAFRFHTLLIQHGRKICVAPVPRCESCTVSDRCRWHRNSGPEKRAKQLRRTKSISVPHPTKEHTE